MDGWTDDAKVDTESGPLMNKKWETKGRILEINISGSFAFRFNDVHSFVLASSFVESVFRESDENCHTRSIILYTNIREI